MAIILAGIPRIISTAPGWTQAHPRATLWARSAGVSAQRRQSSGFPRLHMATVTTLSSGYRPEHRGLSFWMDRVIKEMENLRSSPYTDVVHDLRVAIRRCRSVAAVMEEVDPDPAWPAMRKVARKLFRGLGALRDAQVMDEWVKKLAPETDPVRTHLQTAFESNEPSLRENALCANALASCRLGVSPPNASRSNDSKPPGTFTPKPCARKNPNPGTRCVLD